MNLEASGELRNSSRVECEIERLHSCLSGRNHRTCAKTQIAAAGGRVHIDRPNASRHLEVVAAVGEGLLFDIPPAGIKRLDTGVWHRVGGVVAYNADNMLVGCGKLEVAYVECGGDYLDCLGRRAEKI